MIWFSVAIAVLLSGTTKLWLPGQQEKTASSLLRGYIQSYRCWQNYVGHVFLGLSMWFLYSAYGNSLSMALLFSLAYVILIISWSDFHQRIIPDLFVVVIVALAAIRIYFGLGENLALSIAGAAALGLPTLLVNFVNKNAIGLGDVKLLAALGLFFALWEGLLLLVVSLFFSAIAGLVLLTIKLARRDTAIPFAPFVGAALLLIFYFM